jgi:hypothetical protein
VVPVRSDFAVPGPGLPPLPVALVPLHVISRQSHPPRASVPDLATTIVERHRVLATSRELGFVTPRLTRSTAPPNRTTDLSAEGIGAIEPTRVGNSFLAPPRSPSLAGRDMPFGVLAAAGVGPALPSIVRRAEADDDEEPEPAMAGDEDRVERVVIRRALAPPDAAEARMPWAPAAMPAAERTPPPRVMRALAGSEASSSPEPPLLGPPVPAARPAEPPVDDLVDLVVRKVMRGLTVEGERRGWTRWPQ